jgi:hypothetical protein
MQWWIQLSEIVRNFSNLGLLIGGAVGLYLAWLRVSAANRLADASLKQAELTRREHVAELYNRAAGQLGDAKLEVRYGAILTLRQISRDYPDVTSRVIELLNAYLRENPRDYGDAEPPIDIQEIMSILRRDFERTRLE